MAQLIGTGWLTVGSLWSGLHRYVARKAGLTVEPLVGLVTERTSRKRYRSNEVRVMMD